MRYFFLLLVIAASVGVFVVYVKPRYEKVQMAKSQVASSNANLSTAAKIKEEREALIARYNDIPKEDLDNLETLLPDSVNNIRLIIQLDALATKNGLSTLRNVDYETADEEGKRAANPEEARKPYGEFVISFDTVGQYKNFLSFISDLEENLRLVDVTKIEFREVGDMKGVVGQMSYRVTLKTYWLKQ